MLDEDHMNVSVDIYCTHKINKAAISTASTAPFVWLAGYCVTESGLHSISQYGARRVASLIRESKDELMSKHRWGWSGHDDWRDNGDEERRRHRDEEDHDHRDRGDEEHRR
jgi:hypothetical protein